MTRRTAELDPSGSPEAHLDPAVFHHGWDLANSPIQLEHPSQRRRIFLDVPVFQLCNAFAEFLTGGVGVGSTGLAEDDHMFGH